jgi:hypothetical protein
MQYYYLLISLPLLSLKARAEISFKEMMEIMVLNLAPRDLEKIRQLLRPIDLYNMRALWLGRPFDDRGNFSSTELEELLLVQDEQLPPYVLEFLDRYDHLEERLAYFSSLLSSFYSQEERDERGFLQAYYQFERETRLILSALRAKRQRRNIVQELQFEDPFDPLVSFLLAQKDTAELTVPREFEDLKSLFVENGSEPEKLHRALLEYRWEKIEEMGDAVSFGIDEVLGYIAKFLIVDEWFRLDREKGQIAVDELSQYE